MSTDELSRVRRSRRFKRRFAPSVERRMDLRALQSASVQLRALGESGMNHGR